MGIVLLAFAIVVVLGLAGCESAPPAKPPEAPAAPAAPTAAPPPAAPAVTAPPAPASPPPAPAVAPPVTAPATPPAPEQSPVEAVRVLFIKTSFANFRAAPGTGGKILAVLRQGTRVEVIETRDQWHRVRLADGREGWVAESVTRE